MKQQLIGLTLFTAIANCCISATFNIDHLIADPAILGQVKSKFEIIAALKSGRPVNIITRGELTLYPDGSVKGTGQGGVFFDAKRDVIQINSNIFCNGHVCTGFSEIPHHQYSYKNANAHANAEISSVATSSVSAYAVALN